MRSFKSLLSTPVAAVVVAGTVFVCFASPPPDSETILWPLGLGTTPQVIGNHHGQLLSKASAERPWVHRGLDLLPNPETPPRVYAVADGQVLRCALANGMQGNTNCGLVIGAAGDAENPGEAFMYWHLEPTTITKRHGDTVSKDDLLGTLATWSPREFTHLHFERVKPDGPLYIVAPDPERRSWVPWISTVSPARRLFYGAGAKAVTPMPLKIRFFDSETGVPFDEESEAPGPATTEVSGSVDVVVRVVDEQRPENKEWTDSWAVIPYRLAVSVVGPVKSDGSVDDSKPVFKNELVVDGSIKKAEIGEVANAIYQTSGACKSMGTLAERRLYLVVTGVDGGDTRKRSLLGATVSRVAWDTTDPDLVSGTYRVTVTAFDAADNPVGEETESVIVTKPDSE